VAQPEDRHPQRRGNWVDAEIEVCTSGPNTLVTSRKPDDLPAFCEQLVKVFQQQSLPA
jgi:protease I